MFSFHGVQNRAFNASSHQLASRHYLYGSRACKRSHIIPTKNHNIPRTHTLLSSGSFQLSHKIFLKDNCSAMSSSVALFLLSLCLFSAHACNARRFGPSVGRNPSNQMHQLSKVGLVFLILVLSNPMSSCEGKSTSQISRSRS